MEKPKRTWRSGESRSACRRRRARAAGLRIPFFSVALLLLVTVVAMVSAPAIDAASTTPSQTLRQQLAQKQAELNKATGKLNALQRELDRLAEQQNAVEVRLAELEQEIADTEKLIAQSQADLDATLATLEERLVSLYKQDSTGGWLYAEALLSQEDLTSVLSQLDSLSQIAEEDQKLFDEVEAYLQTHRDNKRRLEEKQAEQRADLEELGRVQTEASEKFAAADQTYDALKAQVNQLKAEIRKADAAAAKAAEEARRRAIQRMAWQKGKSWNNGGAGTIQPPPFTFPVKGAHSYINSWGFDRSGGRTHKGCDIMAARGTPLVACVSGTISRTHPADSGLGGISIHIQGNNGYVYYYCHLDRIASGITAGMSIKAGAIVGYVGNTGNARGGPYHLHFGMQAGGRSWVNPYATLKYYD